MTDRSLSRDEWIRLWREAREHTAALAYHEHIRPGIEGRRIRHNRGPAFDQALEELNDRMLCWWQDDYEWHDWDRWARFKNLLARCRAARDPFRCLRSDYAPEPVYSVGEIVCE